LITSLGYRQAHVEYDKQPRASGQSGWTLTRKIALVANSVTAFSAFPIHACLVLGMALMGVGALVGVAAIAAAGTGVAVIVAAVLVVGGAQLVGLAIVGEYVWRALEEARRRPPYLIEARAGDVETRQVAVE
jgi:dolichol-phosphate mannosyltransferase